MGLEDRALWLLWKTTPKVDVDGIEVGLADAEHNVLLPKVRTALTQLRRDCPDVFAKVQQALPRILIRPLKGYLARYYSALGLCELRSEYLAHPNTSSARVALTLVHEATHARISARQLRAKGLSYLREERLAARAELEVARRLGGAESLLPLLQRKLDEVAIDYSQARREQNKLRAAMDSGVPAWMVKAVARCRGVDFDEKVTYDPFVDRAHRSRTGSSSSRMLRLVVLVSLFAAGIIVAVSVPRLAFVAPVPPLLGWVLLRRRGFD